MTYYFATIEQDDYSENPRDEWECVGTLYTWHRNYKLGGKDDFNHQTPIYNRNVWCFDQFNELANLKELKGYYSYEGGIYFEWENGEDEKLTHERETFFNQTVNAWIEENVCILPVYMYDHSGITISTGPFSCPWDSGQVGIIYVTKQKYEVETQKPFNFEDAEIILKGEINTLDQYLTGDIWGYTIYSTEDPDFENEILTHNDDLPDDRFHESSCGGFFGYTYCEEQVKELLTYYSTTRNETT
jgi:hypothetical protein